MFLILHIFTIITLRSFQTFSLPLSLERPVLSAMFGFPTLSRILTEQSQRHTMSNAVFPIVYLKSVMSLWCQIKNTAAFSCQQLNILRQTYTLSKKKKKKKTSSLSEKHQSVILCFHTVISSQSDATDD